MRGTIPALLTLCQKNSIVEESVQDWFASAVQYEGVSLCLARSSGGEKKFMQTPLIFYGIQTISVLGAWSFR